MKRREVFGAAQLWTKVGHLAIVQPMTVFVTPGRNLIYPLTQFVNSFFVESFNQCPTMLIKECFRLIIT